MVVDGASPPKNTGAERPVTAAPYRLRPDDVLVAAYIECGDQSAFGTLVERHQERIFGYLVGMVRDRSVANDLFQETFLRVIAAMGKERSSYAQQGRWLGWVMRIARNAALDHLRRRKKWVDVEPDQEGEGMSFWDGLSDDEPAPDVKLHRGEQRDRLEEYIDRLPPEQRDVVLLRHETDLTFREIAELTGVSINTALGRMRYALLNLRKMMAEEGRQDLAI